MLFCPRLIIPESRVFAKNGSATTDMPLGQRFVHYPLDHAGDLSAQTVQIDGSVVRSAGVVDGDQYRDDHGS
jgi:hypothetical protein